MTLRYVLAFLCIQVTVTEAVKCDTYQLQHKEECVDRCPDGFGPNLDRNLCLPCPKYCAKCPTYNNECIQCEKDRRMSVYLKKDNGTFTGNPCAYSSGNCPIGFFDKNIDAEVSSSSRKELTKYCLQCPPNCQTCDDAVSCKECAPGATMDKKTKKCVKKEEEGDKKRVKKAATNECDNRCREVPPSMKPCEEKNDNTACHVCKYYTLSTLEGMICLYNCPVGFRTDPHRFCLPEHHEHDDGNGFKVGDVAVRQKFAPIGWGIGTTVVSLAAGGLAMFLTRTKKPAAEEPGKAVSQTNTNTKTDTVTQTPNTAMSTVVETEVEVTAKEKSAEKGK